MPAPPCGLDRVGAALLGNELCRFQVPDRGILGDTVRSEKGKAVFEIIKQVRQTSIRFHRDEDQGARRELEVRLNGLLPRQTMAAIRAFSYLSHLANFAEDQHPIRRRRAHAFDRSAPREESMAYALARAQEAGISQAALRSFFASAVICPVLTAHPIDWRSACPTYAPSRMPWSRGSGGPPLQPAFVSAVPQATGRSIRDPKLSQADAVDRDPARPHAARGGTGRPRPGSGRVPHHRGPPELTAGPRQHRLPFRGPRGRLSDRGRHGYDAKTG